MLSNPNLLVKTKVTIPYLGLFAIIANNQVILFLTVPFCKRKREKQEGLKPTGLTSLKLTPQSCVKYDNPETDTVMEMYEPFLSDGFVSLNSDCAQSTSITILRDTGAFQSLILAYTLPFFKNTSSETSVLI